MYSELEVNVVSVERVNEYSALKTERALVSSSPPHQEWPQKGQLFWSINIIIIYILKLFVSICYCLHLLLSLISTNLFS